MTTEAPDIDALTTESSPESAVEAPADADVEAILADPSIITLSNGKKYRVERLKTRGTLRLLAILTGGAQDVLAQTKFSVDMDPQEFAGIFIGAILFSVPEQEDATMRFLQGMVTPYHFITDPRTPAEREANRDAIVELNNLLDDPEIEDSLEIITAVVTIEAPHILSLGKRIMALLPTIKKSQDAKRGSIAKQ